MNHAKLKSVTVYFTAAEYAELQALADDEAVSLAQVVRARMGLPYQRRGAPKGSRKRARKPAKSGDSRAKADTEKRTGGQRGAKKRA